MQPDSIVHGGPSGAGNRGSGPGRRRAAAAAAVLSLLICGAALVARGPARAQEATPQAEPATPRSAEPAPAVEDDRRYSDDILARERSLSSQIMSPFCPGRTLINCSSDQARAYREAFKGYLASGVSEQELTEEFQRRWGDRVRSTPKGVLGWTLPALLLLAGAGALFYALRRFRAAGDRALAGAPPISRELEAELDRELRSRGL